jgi:hypothetical protein
MHIAEYGGNYAIEVHNISLVSQFEILLLTQSGLHLASLNFDMAKLFRVYFPPN